MTASRKFKWWAVYLSVTAGLFLVGFSLWFNQIVLICWCLLITVWVVPTHLVGILDRLHLRGLAFRYARWTAMLCPFPEQREECLLYITRRFGAEQTQALVTHDLEQEIRLLEARLDRPEARVRYAQIVLRAGEEARHQGRLGEALDLCYRPLRLGLQFPDAGAVCYQACAFCLRDMGRFQEALDYAEHGLSLAGLTSDAVVEANQLLRTECLCELGRIPEAQQAAHLAMTQHGEGTARALLLIALAYVALLWNDPANTTKILAIMDSAPREKMEGDALALHGRVLLLQQRMTEAKQDFLDAIPSAAGYTLATCLYHLAHIATAENDQEKAQECRERLLREAPESFQARRLLEETRRLA